MKRYFVPCLLVAMALCAVAVVQVMRVPEQAQSVAPVTLDIDALHRQADAALMKLQQQRVAAMNATASF